MNLCISEQWTRGARVQRAASNIHKARIIIFVRRLVQPFRESYDDLHLKLAKKLITFIFGVP